MVKENIGIDPNRDGWVRSVESVGIGRGMKMPHSHDALELNLVLSGQAYYLVRNRRHDMQPRTLLWLFPAQDHILLDLSSDFSMWVAVFHRRLVCEVGKDRRYAVLRENDPGSDWLRRLTQEETSRLDVLMTELSAAEGESPLLFNAGLRYLLLTSLEAFRKAGQADSSAEVHPAVEKAVRILQAESAMISEEALARNVGMSRSRLSCLFRSQTGVPLVQFRNRQRIGRFLRTYGSGQRMTMLDAALDAGFGSYAQFYRVFTRFMGCTPANYRHKQV